MKARASAKYVRQSPYKVRRVLDLIRGLPVEEAEQVLRFTSRAAADPIGKVLHSAVANAEHNHALDADELFVAEAFADEGPTLRRFQPRARGRATRIRKRTSHITIAVAERAREVN
jgi:large subunit ribosomal protein L22